MKDDDEIVHDGMRQVFAQIIENQTNDMIILQLHKISTDLPRSIPIHGPLDPPPRTQKRAFSIGDDDNDDDEILSLDSTLSCCSRLLPNPILCKGRFMREG
jgi:hypothetical protein